jgi:hypothetical protein
LHLLRSLRIRVQPNEPKNSLHLEASSSRTPTRSSPVESLPVEPSGDRARPPVLQTPPQPHKIHIELHQIPAPAHEISAPPTQRATMEVSPRINDQHLHS